MDLDGKKFDRGAYVSRAHAVLCEEETLTYPLLVSRITAKSINLAMHLTLDIASELYPLAEQDTITLAVAKSLVPDELDLDREGSVDGDEDAPRRVKRELWRSGDQGLAADFEYVMYGKVSQHRLRLAPLSSWLKMPLNPAQVVRREDRMLTAMFRYTNSTTLRRQKARRGLLLFRSDASGCMCCADPYCTCRTAYFSFGGLLMALRGSYRHMAGVMLGENCYLLIRK